MTIMEEEYNMPVRICIGSVAQKIMGKKEIGLDRVYGMLFPDPETLLLCPFEFEIDENLRSTDPQVCIYIVIVSNKMNRS